MRNPQDTVKTRLHRPSSSILSLLVTTACGAVYGGCKDNAVPPEAPALTDAAVGSTGEPALRTPGQLLIPEGLPEALRKDLAAGTRGPERLGRALADAGAIAAPFAEALLASPSVDDVCIGLRALSLLAASAVSRSPTPETLGALINHTSPAIRAEALALASALQSVSALLPRLNAPSGVPLLDKLQIARLAAAWPDPEVVAALGRCVLEAPHVALAEACAVALTTPEHVIILNKEESKNLRASLAAKEPTFVTMVVAEAVPSLFEPSALLRATEAQDADGAALAARLSNQYGEEAGDHALGAAFAADDRVSVRRSIADYSLDLDRVQALSQDADPTVRAAAIGNLARLTPSDQRAARLRPLLGHPVESTRLATIASIAALAPLADAVAALSHYLGQAPESEQPAILAALRTIPDGEAVDALIAALDQPATRPAAWYALISLTGEDPGGDDPGFWRRWRDKRYQRQSSTPAPPADTPAAP